MNSSVFKVLHPSAEQKTERWLTQFVSRKCDVVRRLSVFQHSPDTASVKPNGNRKIILSLWRPHTETDLRFGKREKAWGFTKSLVLIYSDGYCRCERCRQNNNGAICHSALDFEFSENPFLARSATNCDICCQHLFCCNTLPMKPASVRASCCVKEYRTVARQTVSWQWKARFNWQRTTSSRKHWECKVLNLYLAPLSFRRQNA